mgnify:CR=1 FL=1
MTTASQTSAAQAPAASGGPGAPKTARGARTRRIASCRCRRHGGPQLVQRELPVAVAVGRVEHALERPRPQEKAETVRDSQLVFVNWLAGVLTMGACGWGRHTVKKLYLHVDVRM